MPTDQTTPSGDDARVFRGLRQIILETSDDDLREMVGKEFDALASRGRAAAQRALANCKERMPTDEWINKVREWAASHPQIEIGPAEVYHNLIKRQTGDFLEECEEDIVDWNHWAGRRIKKLVALVRAYKKMGEAERHANECLLRGDEDAAFRSTQECSLAYAELQQILEGSIDDK